MTFDKEPAGYEKTVLSDLQGIGGTCGTPEEVASCLDEVSRLMENLVSSGCT
jgi:hypothetical protein